MPLMELPVRSILVPLGEEGVLISPGSQLTESQYNIDWKVTDIVAPNDFHTAGIKKAKQHYPAALAWGSEGSASKMPDLAWNRVLGKDPWPYEEVLALIPLGGMPRVNECVFVHRASKSLIVTDLCFNQTNVEGLGAKLILSLMGTYNKLGISRFFASFIKDKVAFSASIAKLMTHDFDNIIVSHGDNVYGKGKTRLLACLKDRSL